MIDMAHADDWERLRSLPGDHLVPAPAIELTHAVSVEAPPEAIWPWLIQMGAGRGGWYSYDWIDNRGHRSSDVVLPGFRTPAVGDVIPALPGSTTAFIVHDVDEHSHLIMGAPVRNGHHRATWGLAIEPRTYGSRLYARARIASLGVVPDAILRVTAPPAHGLMQRRQLLGIRARAEATGEHRVP